MHRIAPECTSPRPLRNACPCPCACFGRRWTVPQTTASTYRRTTWRVVDRGLNSVRWVKAAECRPRAARMVMGKGDTAIRASAGRGGLTGMPFFRSWSVVVGRGFTRSKRQVQSVSPGVCQGETLLLCSRETGRLSQARGIGRRCRRCRDRWSGRAR
jgi:hypothetical protein